MCKTITDENTLSLVRTGGQTCVYNRSTTPAMKIALYPDLCNASDYTTRAISFVLHTTLWSLVAVVGGGDGVGMERWWTEDHILKENALSGQSHGIPD